MTNTASDPTGTLLTYTRERPYGQFIEPGKQAEERCNRAQAELAHVTRVATSGRDDGLDCP